jgi:hypothetical protein
MDAPGRVVHPLLVVALLLVAVGGYLLGSHRGSAHVAAEEPPSTTRSLSTSGLLLEYPVSWQRASRATPIPGLALRGPVTLVPSGSAGAGLIAGQLPVSEATPLPATFLTRLDGLPHVEVVNLVSTQAYRYTRIGLPNFNRAIDLYVIPAAGSGARVMACFAPTRLTPASQQCERIVSDVALTGPPAETLTPEPIYAKQLSSVVSSLQAERSRARRQTAGGSSVAQVASAAASLAARLSSASESLAALQPPQLVAPAGAALAGALRRAGEAYSALAVAARAESLSEYDTARSAVGAAESQVDAALASFALMGYGSG